MASPIRRDNALPLYHQIANVIRSRIDTEEWSANEQIPSESSLASSFGVSTLTVRQALGLLRQEGRLTRRQGLGTFVSAQDPPADRVRLSVPLHEVTSAVVGLRVRVLDVQKVRGPRDVVRTLGVEEGQEVVRIRRVRLSGQRPMSYAISYLPNWLAGDLSRTELSRPLLIDVLESKRGIRFREAYQTIEASVADPEAGSVLRVPFGSPLLLVRRTYELEPGKIAYVAINRYPSHLFRYEIRLVRQDLAKTTWEVAPDGGSPNAKPLAGNVRA